MTSIVHRDVLIHDAPRDIVDGDICLFFYSQFEDIKLAQDICRSHEGYDKLHRGGRLIGTKAGGQADSSRCRLLTILRLRVRCGSRKI